MACPYFNSWRFVLLTFPLASFTSLYSCIPVRLLQPFSPPLFIPLSFEFLSCLCLGCCLSPQVDYCFLSFVLLLFFFFSFYDVGDDCDARTICLLNLTRCHSSCSSLMRKTCRWNSGEEETFCRLLWTTLTYYCCPLNSEASSLSLAPSIFQLFLDLVTGGHY